MNKPTPSFRDSLYGSTQNEEGGNKALDTLFLEYQDRHTSLYTWSPITFFFVKTTRLFGRDPYAQVMGFITIWFITTLYLFIPALAVTAITGTWQAAPINRWLLVATIWGSLVWIFHYQLIHADKNIVALHSALAKANSLRKLIAWDRRWFSYPVVGSIATLFVGIIVVLYVVTQTFIGWEPIHPGTLALGIAQFYIIGELVASLLLLVAEYPMLVRQPFRLHWVDPEQTLEIQKALRGYNQLAILSSLYMTSTILITVALLPIGSLLTLPLTILLLILAYAAIVVAPRVLINSIVWREKQKNLKVLQKYLDDLWVRIPSLSSDELGKLKDLRAIHAEMSRPSKELLGIYGTLGKIFGSIILPTLAAICANALQRILVFIALLVLQQSIYIAI